MGTRSVSEEILAAVGLLANAAGYHWQRVAIGSGLPLASKFDDSATSKLARSGGQSSHKRSAK